MWWKHVLAFLAGVTAAVICIVVGFWIYIEIAI
jgi:hypothetical protein